MRATFLLFVFLFTVFFIQAQDAWTQLNDFPFETNASSSFIYENDAYIQISDEIYMYNEAEDSWVFFMNINSAYEAPFVLGNAVFFLKLSDEEFVLEVHSYNFVEEEWTTQNPINYESIAFFDVPKAESFVINDEAYVFLAGNEAENFKKYNATEDSWSTLENLPVVIHGRTQSFTLAGAPYVIFGYEDFGPELNILWKYDIITNIWEEKTSFPDGYRFQTGIFVLNDLAYVGTGEIGGGTTDRFHRYDPETNTWELIEPCGYDTFGSFSFALNNRGYIGVGSRFELPTGTDSQEYFPQKEVWRLDPEQLSVEEIEAVSTVVYPNPTSNNLRINNLPENSFMEVYDMQGKQVTVDFQDNYLNVSHLSSGIYFLKINSDTSEQVIKFIKR